MTRTCYMGGQLAPGRCTKGRCDNIGMEPCWEVQKESGKRCRGAVHWKYWDTPKDPYYEIPEDKAQRKLFDEED